MPSTTKQSLMAEPENTDDHNTDDIEVIDMPTMRVDNATDLVAAHVDAIDQVEIAESVPVIERCPVPWKHPLKFGFWAVKTIFGLASLIFMLAVVAAIPIVNFLALGYLLEVEGRIARTGRFKDVFPLLNDAPRIGSIALGVWLFLLPLRFLGGWAADAALIDPGSSGAIGSAIGLNILWVLISAHLIFALARGGSPGCFVRPFKNIFWLVKQLRSGSYLQTANQQIAEFVKRLRIRHHLWFGLRGFGVAFVWLFIPTLFYAAVQRPEGPQILLMLLGGLLLTITLSWVPFLQARFAAENNFRAGLQLGEVRRLYRYAPVAWTLATVVLYLLALPLYLFKAFLLPADAMWLITLIFIVSIYPTKVITGWAYHRAVKKQREGLLAHYSIRWLCTGVLMPLLGIFVFILFFTQFLGEQGKEVLFHHHALLLPAPFQGAINP